MKFAGQSIGSSQFGASTFLASAHPSESCGSNGLPLTPNSIRIIGHAQELFKVSHPNLCSYIDILRGKHERIVVVQEFYSSNLKSAVDQNEEMRTESFLTKMMYEVLQGIVYLNDFGTVCRNLSPSAILIDPSGSAKLYGYGLYYMTESGSTISFPIGIPKYLPPEVLASDFQTTVSAFSSSMLSICGNPVWDTWSLGIIVLETLLNLTLFDSCNVYEIVENILSMAYCSEKLFLDELITYHQCQAQFDNLSSGMKQFLSECLTVSVEHRPIPRAILSHSIFSDFGTKKLTNRHQMFGSERDHLADQNIRMVYHWWRLAGGNMEQELKEQKLIQNVPSILSLPRVVLKEGEVFGGAFVNRDYCSPSTIVLNLSNLRKKLSHVPAEDFYPLVTQEQNETDETCALNLPLVIREKDVVYQFKRMILFERLLRASPYKLERLRSEAEKDIPPYFRGQIWASLLGLPNGGLPNGGLPNGGFVKERYEEIDKETQTPTDRQIEVDIPRCHQYDELLSSPTGHAKFTRILKAWVVSHPHLVYWQGLDSLCAPFLYLNFQNEGLAYACLSAFISKYLKGFFLKDNSAIIQDYLARFSHLIAFHNPHLFMHLHRIGFVPELYAIPWFLTMFTHVFPLQKIFVLWDTLLLGNSSLPLCFGVAILLQLRDRLLQFGFNECILLFSDMPDIDMEKVVNEAVDLFNSTPASLVHCRNSNSRSEKTRNFTENNEEFEEVDVSLTELKNELCGRISGGDLLNLMSRKNVKVLPLDIRSSEEFGRGALANSMSVPYDSLISTHDEIGEEVFSKVANSSKGKIIVVIGSSRCFCQVVKVAEMLLSKGLQRVCVLHKGIEVFRGSGYLIVT